MFLMVWWLIRFLGNSSKELKNIGKIREKSSINKKCELKNMFFFSISSIVLIVLCAFMWWCKQRIFVEYYTNDFKLILYLTEYWLSKSCFAFLFYFCINAKLKLATQLYDYNYVNISTSFHILFDFNVDLTFELSKIHFRLQSNND